jgi:hypothetical protein
LKKSRAKFFLSRIAAVILLSLFLPGASWAVTRGELVSNLFRELGYGISNEIVLPPDVPSGHVFSKQIGSAVRYGLLPKTPFMPDSSVDRHDAVKLVLSMIGWGFEASLYESMAALPEFAGSGDSVFFLAAEMNPPAPPALLIDGQTPLSESGQSSLLSWARNCKKSVSWNRVIPYNGTDFIIYRQGVARPGEPNTPGTVNPVGAPGNEPLYVTAIGVHAEDVDTRLAFAASLGQERAALSDFAYAYDPIGVINGGFFAGARPLGSMLLDGYPAGKPLEGRSALGWNNGDGSFAFGPGFARVGVRAPGGFVQFDRYNIPPQANEASLYNSGVMTAAAGTALDALELVVKGGVVVERREGSWGNHFMLDGCAMIVARGNSRSLLEGFKPGDPIDIASDWDSAVFSGCTDLIQAGPMLLRNNQFVPGNETFKSDVTDKRHPRTLVGTDGERLIWAVIDGRSSIHSLGTTMDETRYVARALGMSTAINMDGGGSSELIWRGIITNMPSDGKERPLPYAVLMMPKGADMARKRFPETPASYSGFSASSEAIAEESAEYADTYDPNGSNP